MTGGGLAVVNEHTGLSHFTVMGGTPVERGERSTHFIEVNTVHRGQHTT